MVLIFVIHLTLIYPAHRPHVAYIILPFFFYREVTHLGTELVHYDLTLEI